MMAVIFVLSSQSGLRVSEDPAVDKPLRVTGHLLAFGLLGGLLLLALARDRQPRPRDAALAFVITVAYGLLDELHQSFVPDRTGRLDDVVTDTVGALIGIGVAWLLLTVIARSRAGAIPGNGP
jgi:VanZ family protein